MTEAELLREWVAKCTGLELHVEILKSELSKAKARIVELEREVENIHAGYECGPR